mmetsp:Transcript_261/g.779  ORF Transcript_261/g.779 Transcript_261/m.779 type:complete len:218 (+) Transcript_261:1065-1718(+)
MASGSTANSNPSSSFACLANSSAACRASSWRRSISGRTSTLFRNWSEKLRFGGRASKSGSPSSSSALSSGPLVCLKKSLRSILARKGRWNARRTSASTSIFACHLLSRIPRMAYTPRNTQVCTSAVAIHSEAESFDNALLPPRKTPSQIHSRQKTKSTMLRTISVSTASSGSRSRMAMATSSPGSSTRNGASTARSHAPLGSSRRLAARHAAAAPTT